MTLRDYFDREKENSNKYRKKSAKTAALTVIFSAAAMILIYYYRMYAGSLYYALADLLEGPLSGLIATLKNTDIQTAVSIYNDAVRSAVTADIYQMITSMILIFIPYYILLKATGGKVKDSWHLKPVVVKKPWAVMIFSLGVGYGVNIIASLIFAGFGYVPDNVLPGTDMLTPGSVVTGLISTAIIPAIAEEWAMRGVVLRGLAPCGRSFAVITSAAIFGMIHGEITQSIFAFFFGIILAECYFTTGSMWMGIILHAFNNCFAYFWTILAAFRPGDAVNIISTFWVMFCVVFTLAFSCIIFFGNKRKNPFYREPELTDSPRIKFAALKKEPILVFSMIAFVCCYVMCNLFLI